MTITARCSETVPVPEQPSQSRDEVPYNPGFIIYYLWLIISSKKLCLFRELLTATAQESQPTPKLQHSSDTGQGPGLSLNRAQGQVGLRSQVRLLWPSCSHEVLTNKPDDLMMMMILNTVHEAKLIYSCVGPKADSSHLSGPLPK